MMKRLVLLVALCGVLAGCGEPGSAKEKPVEQVIPPLGRLPELPPQPVPSQPPVTVTQTVAPTPTPAPPPPAPAPAPAPQPAITIPLPRGF